MVACETPKKKEAIELHWEFLEFPPNRVMACLSEQDVNELRERLIRCGKPSAD